MKYIRCLIIAAAGLTICGNAAAQSRSLERQIEALKEDVMVLQRQAYRNKANGIAPASAEEVAVKIGQFDEELRRTTGRMDELAYKVKQLEEKINLLNKDLDVRIRLIEGKPITGGEGMVPLKEAAKFNAPVAQGAPKTIIGDAIAKGEDLPAVKTETAEEIYQKGLEAINQGQAEEAAVKFTAVLTKFPDHKLAGNAQYWLGEAYYSRKDFAKAAVAFGKGYQKYKNGNKGADSLYKLGMSMKELGKKAEACAAFVSLPQEFPKAEKALKDKAASQAKDSGCQ